MKSFHTKGNGQETSRKHLCTGDGTGSDAVARGVYVAYCRKLTTYG